MKKKIKSWGLRLLSFGLIAKGFIADEARSWVKAVFWAYRDKTYSFAKTRWAVKRGFLPGQVERQGITEENYQEILSPKEYAFLRPLNGIYSKWLTDIVSVNTIFKPYRDKMPTCYYQINKRDGKTQIIPLYDRNAGDHLSDVIALLESKGRLKVQSSSKRKTWTLSYHDKKYFLNGKRLTRKELRHVLKSFPGIVVITEDVAAAQEFIGGRLRLFICNEHGDDPRISDAYMRFRRVKRRVVSAEEAHVDTLVEQLSVEYNAAREEYSEELLPDGSAGQDDDTDEVFLTAEEIKEAKRAARLAALEEMDESFLTPEDIKRAEKEAKLAKRLTKLEEMDESFRTKDLKLKNFDPRKPLFYRVDTQTGALTLSERCAGMAGLNPTTAESIPEHIPCWQEICDTVDSLCRFAPQLEFFGMEIVITADGFRITRMLNHPPYPTAVPFCPETNAYLKKKVAQKRAAHGAARKAARAGGRIKRLFRSTFSSLFFPKHLLPYLSIRWLGDEFRDFRTNKDTTWKEKWWAFRHGFISYRLHQYGITKENWTNYISDLEYKWLRHINNKYRHWMEDKITVKYVCSEYNDCFPGYYYHIVQKNDANKVIPMMDCPEGYGADYEDIIRLVREKGALALKPDEGSHGDGFYKFSWEDGEYRLNHQSAQVEDVLAILQNPANQYLVTEYIDMHDEIKRIYSGAVNTIRMIVFKKDGKNPVIGNAYMRFGSQRTGAVDNMGAGGMYARVDVDTGRFYDAKIIEANEIKPCLYHPDTNVKIDGYLPNWEKVKQDVLDVARSIPQLEYFGFDLALTADGLKFPEINRFPDYPAIEKYTPETIDYLLYKLSVKKHLYGYDKKPNRTLFHLPRR